jgi:outer membrane protein assembly factor BamB
MRRLLVVVLSLALGGCGLFDWFGSDDPHPPAPLTEITPKVTVTALWNTHIGSGARYFFTPALLGDDIIVADVDGNISRLNAATGAQVWKISTPDKLAAGVGADAGTFAVATQKGEVVAYDPDGKERWRSKPQGEVLSAPAVGDGVIVSRTTDGRFVALDSGTGAKRWNYQRQAQPLVLRAAPGMIVSAGFVYAGMSGGRLVAITDTNGGLRWDAAVTIPKGTTELERVADVMGTPALAGREVCVATFQGRAGCFDLASGGPVWTRDISTSSGIGVDGHGAYVSDEKSDVQAYARAGGASMWKNDKLLYRRLGTPVPFMGSVVVGDYQGFLHWLSEEDGSIVARMPTDGVRRLIVQTSNGGIYAFAAQ